MSFSRRAHRRFAPLLFGRDVPGGQAARARLLDARVSGDRAQVVRILEELRSTAPEDLGLRMRLARARLRSGLGVGSEMERALFEREVDDSIIALDDGRAVRDTTVRQLLWSIHLSPEHRLLHPRLARLDEVLVRAARREPRSVEPLVGRSRVLLASRDRAAFLASADSLPETDRDGASEVLRTASRLRSVAHRWAASVHPDMEAPKVFGIGLSRTGTRSFDEALRILGFESLHWQNDLTMDLIRPDDLPLFDGFSDTVVTAFFEPLLHMFPAARFVWTTRPLESWVRSVSAHYLRNIGATGPADLLKPPVADTFRGLKGRIEASLYAHHASWEAAYRAHEQRVMTFFATNAPDRLLRLSVVEGEGWEPLCEFLDVPVPDVPFPHANRRPDHESVGRTDGDAKPTP